MVFCNTKSKKIGIVAALSINAFEGTTHTNFVAHTQDGDGAIWLMCYDLRFSDADAATTGRYLFV